MGRSSLLLLVIVAVVAFVSGHAGHDHDHEDHGADSDVVVLGDADFDTTVQSNQYVFAEFYAPWCGHCKSLVPEYEKLATHFKGSNVIIAKVDATVNNEVATKNGVRGYPSLKFFRNAVPTDYEGGRSSADMIRWITKKTQPASTAITTAEDITKFVEQAGVKVVAYISADDTDSFLAAAASEGLDDFAFAHVTDKALFGDKAESTVVIYKAGEGPVVWNGEFSKEKVVEFVLSEGFPLVEELAQKIWQRSSGSQTPLLAVFVESSSDDNLALARDIALKFKGKVLTSYSTAASLAERWGTSGKVFPTGVLVQWKGQEPKLSVFDEDASAFTVESGTEFVEMSLNSEYKSFKKSQPVPESNDGPVKVLVGKNFDEIVNNPEKDVFVEFYAPWCGHCKTLAPIWDELGNAFADVSTVVIAKMDATANSYPNTVEIRGFPTLLFFPADSKVPVPYNGDRDLESLKKFVTDEASRPVKQEL